MFPDVPIRNLVIAIVLSALILVVMDNHLVQGQISEAELNEQQQLQVCRSTWRILRTGVDQEEVNLAQCRFDGRLQILNRLCKFSLSQGINWGSSNCQNKMQFLKTQMDSGGLLNGVTCGSLSIPMSNCISRFDQVLKNNSDWFTANCL